MKTAYISPYRDGTGYSYAAIANILAADAAGIEVVPRPVNMSSPKDMRIPPRIVELERGKLDGIEAVIQYNLPSAFERRSGVLNVGAFAWETTHFNASRWKFTCNLMDHNWVFCQQSRQAVLDSGVDVPVFVVPHAADLSRYDNPPEPLSHPCLKDRCVFYTIGESTRRKNFAGLLRAYYAAFTSRHPVVLVIKTNFPGVPESQAADQARELITGIKRGIHIHRDETLYPPVVFITRRWTEEQIDSLHVAGHVFVMPSRAESWCIPAMDAMGFHNPVIVSNWGSFPDLMYDGADADFDTRSKMFRCARNVTGGWLVPGILTPCFGQDGPSDLYTGGELWFEPDLRAFGVAMQEAYRMWNDGSLSTMGNMAADRVKVFSYDRVGQIIRKCLEAGGLS